MFTGIVADTGEVINLEEAGEGKRFEIESDLLENVEIGESISVSGACLTVEENTEEGAAFFLAEETLDKTWFSELEEGDELNLELSLTPQDRMGGHIVQGHVDGYGEVTEVEELEEGWNFTFELPAELDQYIVMKGFVAVEGISLTVTEVKENSFSVTVIPETWKKTNFSEKDVGDYVNLETDVTAKYIEKMIDNQ